MALWQETHSSFTPCTTGEARHSAVHSTQMNTEPEHCNTLNHTRALLSRTHWHTGTQCGALVRDALDHMYGTHWTTWALSGLCQPPLTLCKRLHAREVEHTDASGAIREPVRQHRELSLTLSPDDTTGSAAQEGKHADSVRTMEGRVCTQRTDTDKQFVPIQRNPSQQHPHATQDSLQVLWVYDAALDRGRNPNRHAGTASCASEQGAHRTPACSKRRAAPRTRRPTASRSGHPRRSAGACCHLART
jgi:hypothetical protein